MENILSENIKKHFEDFSSGNIKLMDAERQMILLELNKYLWAENYYPKDFAYKIEKFRNYLEGLTLKINNRIPIHFSLIAYRLQFIDPENSTFSLQCEISVGASISDTLNYLNENNINITENDIKNYVTLGGVLNFPDDRITQLLENILKVRTLYAENSQWYQYFRYGSASGNIWLIQNFTLNLNQKFDFKDLPFDKFNFAVDFSIGLGTDIVNIDLKPDYSGKPESLFSPHFSSGEFNTLKKSASLAAFGYLQDPSCYFENVIRFDFKLERNSKPIFYRIVLPLILMSSMIGIGSFFSLDKIAMTTQFLPAIFLSIVALQLTASQGIPRGANFSRLDKIFMISYLYIISLFIDFLILEHLILDKLMLLFLYISAFVMIIFRKRLNTKKQI